MKAYKNLDCVLLIDDDDATNFINQLVLEECGVTAHIEICNSGKKALDYLTCSGTYQSEDEYPQPGIVFLDINMPGMNGWEFLDHYHKLPEEQKAKIVVAMLTTSENPDDLQKSKKEKEIRIFLKKPLEEKYVKDLIETNFEEY